MLAAVVAWSVFCADRALANFATPVNGPVEMFNDNLEKLLQLLRANGGEGNLKKGLAVIVDCRMPTGGPGCAVQVASPGGGAQTDAQALRRIEIKGDSAAILRDKMRHALKDKKTPTPREVIWPGWAMCHGVGSKQMWCEVSLDKPKGNIWRWLGRNGGD